VRSYLGNTLHLLGNMTEPAMLAFMLRRLRASAPMLAPFAKIQRRLLKLALQLFGSAENAPRLQVGGGWGGAGHGWSLWPGLGWGAPAAPGEGGGC